MRIGGFQKLTLLDYPGQIAALVFTKGCNFRCPYCHNASLVETADRTLQRPQDGTEPTAESVLEYLEKRSGLVDGLVITGGEPLLQTGLKDFIRQVRALGYLVKLDTNGSFPDRLAALLEEGLLDYVAMDIKQTPERYASLIGTAAADLVPRVLESAALLKASPVPSEFRTTLVKGLHTPEDAEQMAAFAGTQKPYFLQAYVDSGDVLRPEGLCSFSPQELDQILVRVRKYCPGAVLRNGKT